MLNENAGVHIRKQQINGTLFDSKETYKNSEETPIHGTGQGSCASPAIWLMISRFIMEILQFHVNGMEMIDIMKKKTITQWIEGFVDDTSIFSNTPFHCRDIIELKERLKYNSTYWSGLLEAITC
jgi:hypothetical protein